MPRKPSPTRRALTAARWPVGVAATSWSYMWRITPLHRTEHPGTMAEDAPRPFPPELAQEDIQHVEQGVGPLFHRRYHARIRDSRYDARELVERLSSDPNLAAPGGLARFQKVHGEEGRPMRPGDEYVVRMPGPWDGPVRVVEVTPTLFRFATLQGHLEAGQIEWHARDEDELVFGVESWARSGDRLSYLMHNHLRMAKEVQLHMWTSVVERVATLCEGRLEAGIDIDTHRVELGS